MEQNPPLAGLRVLVVEDELMISLLLEEMLIEQECILVGPYNRVPYAIEAAHAEMVDAAILDVNVAGVKAYPVAEILTARGIPFVFLSGYGKQAIPVNRPEWQVCTKPFRSEELMAMLASQVARNASSASPRRQ